MLVAATTQSVGEYEFGDAFEKLGDLEFSNVEIAIHEDLNHIKPSFVAEDIERAVALCQSTHRMNIVGYSVQIDAQGEEHYRQFDAITRLAKATKVVTITVPSAELGTPFNEEVEHLRKLVEIAHNQGVRVGMRSQIGCLSQDPDTVGVLCDNVDGLGLTLDPSHYITGPHQGRSIDKLFKYVYNVHLRDSHKEALQVRVGQGEIEYGRLISQLAHHGYDRALCVSMEKMEEFDHYSEMRKLRLLLESLL